MDMMFHVDLLLFLSGLYKKIPFYFYYYFYPVLGF